MSMSAVQLRNSEPVKADLLCNAAASSSSNRNKSASKNGLRTMQSHPNMRYTSVNVAVAATTQLTPYTVHALSPPSPPLLALPLHNNNNNNTTTITTNNSSRHMQQQQPLSRTQQKLMLQRQCFLADDKDYLNHPDNMRRLTKELERVNREYRCIRRFEHPLAESFRRVIHHRQQTVAIGSTYAASSSSTTTTTTTTPLSPSSAASSISTSPRLQRRSSAQEILISVASKESARRQAPQDGGFLIRALFA